MKKGKTTPKPFLHSFWGFRARTLKVHIIPFKFKVQALYKKKKKKNDTRIKNVDYYCG